ncbi:HD domain-containing protein (plasmid) [Clostridium perfringens]
MERFFYKKALDFVSELFENTTDKGGHPYIDHLIRVSENLNGDVQKTAGLLHDVIEDTEYTYDSLIDYGFPKEIISIVDIVSRRNHETYAEFIQRIIDSGNKCAIELKIADLNDNMNINRIPNPTEKDFNRIKKRYKPAKEKLLTALSKIN